MLSTALRRVVAVLDALHIPYALIGGLALASHNVVRATKDLDFLVARHSLEISNLAQDLEAKGLPAAARKASQGDPVAGVVQMKVPTAQGHVTCDLIVPSFAWQAEAIRNAVSVDLEGLVVRVAAAPDLFLLKLYAGGPQDLLDAAHLLRQQGPAERRSWKTAAEKLKLGSEYARCLKFLK